jgi:hypothetical protein
MDVKKIAKEILQKETPVSDTVDVVTSVPQDQIDAALELAASLSEKLNSLSAEVDLATEDLSGKKSPSILESKDDFKSLVLRLKQIKKKLLVV